MKNVLVSFFLDIVYIYFMRIITYCTLKVKSILSNLDGIGLTIEYACTSCSEAVASRQWPRAVRACLSVARTGPSTVMACQQASPAQ